MKNISLFAMLIFCTSLLMTSCGPKEDDPATPAELQLERLAGDYKTSSSKDWTVTEVLFDGSENRTGDWTGFKLKLETSGGVGGTHQYTATSGLAGGPWPSTGSWEFGGTVDNPNINKIVRDDGLEIAITVSDSELTMTFIFDNNIHQSGKVEAVNGEYSFTFTN